jgi:hypothetical protein
MPKLFRRSRSASDLEHRMDMVHDSCDRWAAHVLKMRSYWDSLDAAGRYRLSVFLQF